MPMTANVAQVEAGATMDSEPVVMRTPIMEKISTRCMPPMTRKSQSAAITATPRKPPLLPIVTRILPTPVPTQLPSGARKHSDTGTRISIVINGEKIVRKVAGMILLKNFSTILKTQTDSRIGMIVCVYFATGAGMPKTRTLDTPLFTISSSSGAISMPPMNMPKAGFAFSFFAEV